MRRAAFVRLACWAALALAPVPARCDDGGPRLVRVTPLRSGEQLVCRLRTQGLPGEKQLQSMRSGLVASVELDLALLDEGGHLLGRHGLSLRMAFDLWDEVFSVRGDGHERRFSSLDDLRSYLADLDNLPVASSSVLGADGRYRLSAALVVHAIAPDERDRVEGVIAGDQRPRHEGQDQQEASVSLGRLIRLFYKGDADGQSGQDVLSDWFTRRELPDASH